MKLLTYIPLLLLCSCSLINENTNNSLDLDQTYQGNGVERYFLASMPSWANFSISGSCKRSSQIRYMNYNELKASYAFDYQKIVNFQHMVNKRIDDKIRNKSSQQLQLKDEAFIFYNVYEQIIGGGRDFVVPDYSKISLLWVDPYINNTEQIKKILKRADFQKGFPILISDCYNSFEFESFIFKHKLNEFGVKFIGADMLSPYSVNSNLEYGFFINIKEYLLDKEITFYGPGVPSSIKGINKNNFIKID